MERSSFLMTPSCFANGMLRKNIMLPSRCRCLSLCPPITTFLSSLIDGCMQRPVFRSHSSISSCPKSSQSPLPSSTCRPYHCRLCTTKNSKHFMPTLFRHSTKYKHRFSKPCILRTKTFSLAPQRVAARRSARNLRCCGYGANRSNWELCASSPIRKWLICVSRSGHRNFENFKEGRRSLALPARRVPIYDCWRKVTLLFALRLKYVSLSVPDIDYWMLSLSGMWFRDGGVNGRMCRTLGCLLLMKFRWSEVRWGQPMKW